MPKNAQRNLRSQLHYLTQKGSVKAYSAEFRRLLLQLPPMDEDNLVDRYLRGLKPQTRMEVELHDPQNLDDAERYAMLVDDIRFRNGGMKRNNNLPSTQPFSRPQSFQRSFQPQNQGPVPMDLDAINSRQGHRQQSSSQPRDQRNVPSLVKCYTCQKSGHFSKNCPQQKKDINSFPHTSHHPRYQQRVNNVETSTHDLGRNYYQMQTYQVEGNSDSEIETDNSPDLPLSSIKSVVDPKDELLLIERYICNRKV